jgi:hypothetical protein
MYTLITNETVEKYPYSIIELRRDNHQTSFPKNPSDSLLAEWGMFPVTPTPQPETDYTKNVTELDPVKTNGEWVQTWQVTDATPEEIEQRTKDQASNIRSERNQLISECDWTQLDDSPITNAKKLEWAMYRQALRDIPSQIDFPWDITWPVKPT